MLHSGKVFVQSHDLLRQSASYTLSLPGLYAELSPLCVILRIPHCEHETRHCEVKM